MKVAFFTATAFLFGLGIASALGWTGLSYSMPGIETDPQVPEVSVKPALDLSNAFVAISDAVTPAVVRIQVRRPHQSVARQGTPLFDFFRDQEEQPGPAPDVVGGGSGFLVSADGYILTNNHVVEDATEIMVFLSDRRAFRAELVGRDPFTDVAVIKVEGDDFAFLSFGSSDEVRVGEWIVAIGNPGFGAGTTLDYTVTAGIVSALGRPLQLLQNELRRDEATRANQGFAIENFIQTDAVINPGNSGGPMVNLRGQVVGINSAIASRTGFYQGYGFAIPINLARRIMEDLVEYGRVRRAFLGVQLGAIDELSAEFYGLPSVSGVELESVTDGGPASRAGLEDHDVIWAVNGESVATQGQLQQKIASRRPGDEVTLTVYRDGSARELRVRLGEVDLTEAPTRVAARPTLRPEMNEQLGIRVGTLSLSVAQDYGYEDNDGVFITDLQPNGAAARRGLFRGQRILAINEVPVNEPEDVRNILDDISGGEIVSFQIEVPGQTRTIHVRMPS
jgi:serine protease Do